AGRPSYRHDLVQDTIAEPAAQPTFTDHINFDSKQFFQVVDQRTVIEQGSTGLKTDEEIDIGSAVNIAPSHGTEQPHVGSPVSLGDLKDLAPVILDVLPCEHERIIRRTRADQK